MQKLSAFAMIGVMLLAIVGSTLALPSPLSRESAAHRPSDETDPVTADNTTRSERQNRYTNNVYGNLQQNIEQPQLGCPIQLTSAFVRSGYISVPLRGPAIRYATLSRGRSLQSTKLYKPYSDSNLLDQFTLMTHAAMSGYLPLNRQHDTPSSSDRVQRLVRVNNGLAAKVTNAGEATEFVMKRWPPICSNREAKIYDPPTFVQLMLINDRSDNYNGALLNVDVRPNGVERLNFIPPAQTGYNGVESECVLPVADRPSTRGKAKPSVIPSTLFMVTYLPCDTQ